MGRVTEENQGTDLKNKRQNRNILSKTENRLNVITKTKHIVYYLNTICKSSPSFHWNVIDLLRIQSIKSGIQPNGQGQI